MTQDQTPETDHEPQGTQPWTAPTLIRLDAGDAEFDVNLGPDSLSMTS